MFHARWRLSASRRTGKPDSRFRVLQCGGQYSFLTRQRPRRGLIEGCNSDRGRPSLAHAPVQNIFGGRGPATAVHQPFRLRSDRPSLRGWEKAWLSPAASFRMFLKKPPVSCDRLSHNLSCQAPEVILSRQLATHLRPGRPIHAFPSHRPTQSYWSPPHKALLNDGRQGRAFSPWRVFFFCSVGCLGHALGGHFCPDRPRRPGCKEKKKSRLG